MVNHRTIAHLPDLEARIIDRVFSSLKPAHFSVQVSNNVFNYDEQHYVTLEYTDWSNINRNIRVVGRPISRYDLPSINITEYYWSDIIENLKHHYWQTIENDFERSDLSKLDFVRHVVLQLTNEYVHYDNGFVLRDDRLTLDLPVTIILDELLRSTPHRSNPYRPIDMPYVPFDRVSNAMTPYPVLGVKQLTNLKATKLLKAWLSDHQLESYNKNKTIPCVGSVSGTEYLITFASEINIQVLTGDNTGRKYCMVATEPVPIEDQMLAQMLIIENDEATLFEKGILW